MVTDPKNFPKRPPIDRGNNLIPVGNMRANLIAVELRGILLLAGLFLTR